MTAAGEIDWGAAHRWVAERQASLDAVLDIRGKRLDALLRERATKLAEPARTGQRPSDSMHALAVGTGSERYGLELARLAGVIPFGQCAPAPGGPDELLGLFSARGEIWAVYEFGRLVGSVAAAPPTGGHVVLLRHSRRRIGLRVDRAERVHVVPLDKLERPSEREISVPAALIRGVTSDSLIVVDLGALWAHPSITRAP